MKKLIFVIACLMALVLASATDDPDFPSLPRIKSLTEWREWADTLQHHEKKWLKSRRDYYPNGELQQVLYVEYNGDTTGLHRYQLNKDSTVKKDIWYNRFMGKWLPGDKYFYHKGERLPYLTKDDEGYTCQYTYDNQRRLTGMLLQDDKKKSFVAYAYIYDEAGLPVHKTEFDFFDDKKDLRHSYLYEYEKDGNGKVIREERFLLPHTMAELVTKTDKQGNQKTTYFGLDAKEKTLLETIFYNSKGERLKKIGYDRESKPQFIWTYVYEYYK